MLCAKSPSAVTIMPVGWAGDAKSPQSEAACHVVAKGKELASPVPSRGVLGNHQDQVAPIHPSCACLWLANAACRMTLHSLQWALWLRMLTGFRERDHNPRSPSSVQGGDRLDTKVRARGTGEAPF